MRYLGVNPTLVTLFGDQENERIGMERSMVADDVYYGGGLWDNITHIFNQAQQAIGQISVKTPAPGAPGGPVAVKSPGFEAMLTNPVVLGGAALVVVMLIMKKKR